LLILLARAISAAYATRQDWSRAGDVLLEGLDALDRLQRVQFSTASKEAWLTMAGDLHILGAEALLRAARVGDAVTTIERGRARLLGEALNRDRAALRELEQTGNERLVERYRTAAEHVRLLSAAAERGKDVQEPLVSARRALDAIVETVREASGGAVFSHALRLEEIVAASATVGMPLVYLVPLSTFGVAIIINGATAQITPVMLPALSTARVNEVVERYVVAYGRFVESDTDEEWAAWQSVLDHTARWAWDACMHDVATALGRVPDAILVPVGRLGRLPLHAAISDAGTSLETTTWRYAPSARALARDSH
jgi:hypothetical protein